MATLQSPINLRRRLRALCSSSTMEKQLNQLRQEAYTSLLTLEHLIGTTPLQLVDFYKEVSPWCDMSSELYQLERKLGKIDYGQYLKARQALVALAAQDERCSSGVNRTSRGQRPTKESTLLGGYRCLGLSTETVAYWESVREDLGSKPALIGRSDSPTIAQVIDARASELLNDGINRWTPLLRALINS